MHTIGLLEWIINVFIQVALVYRYRVRKPGSAEMKLSDMKC